MSEWASGRSAAVRLAGTVVALAVLLQAGEVRLGGSYENRAALTRYRRRTQFLDENRFRLTADAALAPGTRINATGWARLYFGDTQVRLEELLPHEVAERLTPIVDDLNVGFENRLVLDRLFVSARAERFGVKLGKQPLGWGPGYIWNPTEIIPAKSILEPEYDREGQWAIATEATVVGLRAQFLAVPEQQFRWLRQVGRISATVGRFDVALTLHRGYQPDPVPGEGSRQAFAGGQFKGELFGVGIWSEGGLEWIRGESSGYRLCAGVDYTLPWLTYLLTEYYRDSRGDPDGQYAPGQWLGALRGGPRLGQDYIAVFAHQPLLGFHSLGAGTVVNLNDRSATLLPRGTFSLADNLEVEVLSTVALGSRQSEFGAAGAVALLAYLIWYF